VVVRINDRGSFARGRVILVSRAAAEELGMIHDGTAHVRLSVVEGDQARTGRCGDGERVAEREVAPEASTVGDMAATAVLQPDAPALSEPAEVEVTQLSEPPDREGRPTSSETIAARFAVAFQPETWQQAEFAKVIAAFAPRLAARRRSGRAHAVVPWPALDGLTPIQLTPTLVAYAWSSELSLPNPVGFVRAVAPTRLTQLTQ